MDSSETDVFLSQAWDNVPLHVPLHVPRVSPPSPKLRMPQTLSLA